MLVVAHRSLEAARTRRLVDLQQLLVLVDLEERTHIVRLGDEQTGIMDATVNEIFVFYDGGLHEGRRVGVLGLVQQIDGFVEVAG